MPRQLFISGKNWKLSLAELASYLKARKIEFEVQFFSKDFFHLAVAEEFSASAIEDLGGIIKIGEVKAEFDTNIVKEAFLRKNKNARSQIVKFLASSTLVDDMEKSTDKIFFGISVYCTEKTLQPLSRTIQRFVGSFLKNELASYGKKSKFMGFSRDRKFPQLSHVEVLKKNLVENKAEVLLCMGKKTTWVGSTVAVHNPFEFQKRDIHKPIQRKIFAMPPRLARIMVNLSACVPGKVLLDPFCGVGAILQEALLERAQVIGVDVNSWCVKAAKENLEWLEREYNLEEVEFRVLQGNVSRLAEKIGRATVDCIATEPDLGPALRQIPTGPYALKVIQKLEPLYFDLVREAHEVLTKDGKLVLMTPYIRTRSGQPVRMPISEKLEDLNFRRTQLFSKEMFSGEAMEMDDLTSANSLIEVDKQHKVGREIHVYQK
jgi:tRNA G10  N-methylase Trm11